METSDFSVEKRFCEKLGRNVIVKTDHRNNGSRTCLDNDGCEKSGECFK